MYCQIYCNDNNILQYLLHRRRCIAIRLLPINSPNITAIYFSLLGKTRHYELQHITLCRKTKYIQRKRSTNQSQTNNMRICICTHLPTTYWNNPNNLLSRRHFRCNNWRMQIKGTPIILTTTEGSKAINPATPLPTKHYLQPGFIICQRLPASIVTAKPQPKTNIPTATPSLDTSTLGTYTPISAFGFLLRLPPIAVTDGQIDQVQVGRGTWLCETCGDVAKYREIEGRPPPAAAHSACCCFF